MNGRVDVIIAGGECDFGLESTIVKINDDGTLTLLRPGKITKEDLESIGLEVIIANAVTDGLKEGERAISPGMKYRHYAPSAPVILLDGATDQITKFIKEASKDNERIAVIAYEDDIEIIAKISQKIDVYPFGARGDEQTQARLLFKLLRDADDHNYDVIYAPLPKMDGIGLALYNRMIRAAAHNIIRL